jgi:hypothetical protein
MPPLPPMPVSPMNQGYGAESAPAGGPVSPAALLGSGAMPPAQSTPVVSPEQQSEAFMMQVRELTMQIDGLAQMHPEVGEDLEIAKQALVNAMTKALMVRSTTEPGSAPAVIG